MIYEREIKEIGGSSMLIIPTDLAKYLDITFGNTVCIEDEKGKKGKYITIWKKEE